MKSVMLSIKPEYCALIANGKKTIEVRKTRPKIEPPFKCYIYCTNDGRPLVYGDVYRGSWESEYVQTFGYSRAEAERIWGVMNGKVIGEFVCDGIISVDCDSIGPFDVETKDYIVGETCLSRKMFWSYANGCKAFGWHISDPKIYDEPMPLNGFKGMCKYMDRDCFACPYYDYTSMDCVGRKTTRPPQSWCYVEEL